MTSERKIEIFNKVLRQYNFLVRNEEPIFAMTVTDAEEAEYFTLCIETVRDNLISHMQVMDIDKIMKEIVK